MCPGALNTGEWCVVLPVVLDRGGMALGGHISPRQSLPLDINGYHLLVNFFFIKGWVKFIARFGTKMIEEQTAIYHTSP